MCSHRDQLCAVILRLFSDVNKPRHHLFSHASSMYVTIVYPVISMASFRSAEQSPPSLSRR
jgi:hypothetical protein